jgi:NAD(P)-dependent dehydrogenase (short-subunit alcohol dehydrogenase family)
MKTFQNGSPVTGQAKWAWSLQTTGGSGASVLLNDIGNPSQKSAHKSSSTEMYSFAGDASDVSFTQQMVREAVNFGKLDIAIANAGITLLRLLRLCLKISIRLW